MNDEVRHEGRPRRQIPWVWVGVALVMVVALVRQLLMPAQAHPLVGQPAPPLSLPLADPSGDRLRLEDLRGEVVVLDFWATWCGACRASVPALNALSERYAERGVRVVGVNVDSRNPEPVAAGHRAFGMRYPTVYDPEQRAQLAFDVDVLPTLVLIDSQGVVREWAAGVPEERDWARRIADRL